MGGQYGKGMMVQLAALAVMVWAGADKHGGWAPALADALRTLAGAAHVGGPLGALWLLGNFFFFPYVWSYYGAELWGRAGDVVDDDQRHVAFYADGRVQRGTGAGCAALVFALFISILLWFAAFLLGPIIARIYTWRKRQALYYDRDSARYAEAVNAEKRLRFLLRCIVIAGAAAVAYKALK